MSGAKLLNSLAWLLGGSVPRNRDELRRLVKLAGERSPLLTRGATKMLNNVISLTEVRVEEVMIPYGKVDWLSSDDSYAAITRQVGKTLHSRYPVLGADKEKIIGILHVKLLLGIKADDNEKILETRGLTKPARTVPESRRLDEMLRDFQHYRKHMAIVADEDGKPAGLVTIEDVLEHIVGAIHDEFDDGEATTTQIKHTGEGRLQAEGDTSLVLLNKELTKHKFGHTLDTGRSETVGGWLANQLGKMPAPGDTIDEGGLTLKVGRTDERKVLSVDIAKVTDEPGAAKES